MERGWYIVYQILNRKNVNFYFNKTPKKDFSDFYSGFEIVL